MMKKAFLLPVAVILTVILTAPVLPGCAAPSVSPGSPVPVKSQSSPGTSISAGTPFPSWGDDPSVGYPRHSYLTAEGRGTSKDAADRNALAALAAFFGQSIRSDLQSLSVYRETIGDGDPRSSSTEEITEALNVSVSMDSLLGAEIRERWDDGRGLYYALAVMEKAGAIRLYTELFNSGQRVIDRLTLLPPDEKYSLEGALNYRRAASLADANKVLVPILSVLGSPLDFSGLRTGEEYRMEAAEIIREIPVLVRVKEGKADPVKNAFAGVLSEAGFRTGGQGSRYVLEVDAALSPALPGGQYQWCSYEISADLTDTRTNTVLLPYGIHGREGHLRYEDAEKRALRDAEGKIRQSYGNALGEYLRNLLEGGVWEK
jgi:hypothetical protein